MAQKVHIVLVDDIDGSEAAESVTFGLDGATYQIDLSDGNASRLREFLAEFVGHGRKTGGTARKGRRAAASVVTREGPSARQVRDWARSNGWDVPDRGRVSAEVRAAFEAAHAS